MFRLCFGYVSVMFRFSFGFQPLPPSYNQPNPPAKILHLSPSRKCSGEKNRPASPLPLLIFGDFVRFSKIMCIFAQILNHYGKKRINL